MQNTKKTKEYTLKERTGKHNLLLNDIKAEVLEEEVTEPVNRLIIIIMMIMIIIMLTVIMIMIMMTMIIMMTRRR